MLNINQLIREKLKTLQQSGVDSSTFEIKLLLSSILQVEPKSIDGSRFLNTDQTNRLDKMIKQRLEHMPADKIIGQKGFYKYDFSVDENVLSPRADSEVLVEKALGLLKGIKSPRVLELGVGSGCLILSILAEINRAFGVGLDISSSALNVSQSNALKLNIEPERIKFYLGSWFDESVVSQIASLGEYDLLISNPPYIATAEIATLEPEVKDHDPLIALDGGADGLRDYRQILAIAPRLIKPNGYIIFEAGDSAQLNFISHYAAQYDFDTVEIARDLSGKDRCIILKK